MNVTKIFFLLLSMQTYSFIQGSGSLTPLSSPPASSSPLVRVAKSVKAFKCAEAGGSGFYCSHIAHVIVRAVHPDKGYKEKEIAPADILGRHYRCAKGAELLPPVIVDKDGHRRVSFHEPAVSDEDLAKMKVDALYCDGRISVVSE